VHAARPFPKNFRKGTDIRRFRLLGSLSQIRECTNTLLRFSKENTISTILIGHITKDGQLAGPKILEHMVDTVLQFEGDQHILYRILRSMKNRFGSTSEIGIYEMLQSGLRQVTNPSELLLSNHDQELSGIAVSATVEGVRPILLEVQSLVSTAAYGVPQRSATGFDSRRLNMLLAVLEKRVGFKLAAKDVFLNIAGGIRVSDPALDLAVVMAVLRRISMQLFRQIRFLPERSGFQVRFGLWSRIEQRISEAEKLGFKRIFVPLGNKKGFTRKATHIEWHRFQITASAQYCSGDFGKVSAITAIICPESGISEMFSKNCRFTEDLS